jgi:hypothetical protein
MHGLLVMLVERAGEIGFFEALSDGLKLKLHAEARAHFLSKVDVVADDLVVLIAVAHRRQDVVQAQDERALVQNLLKRIILRHRRNRHHHNQHRREQHRKKLLHPNPSALYFANVIKYYHTSGSLSSARDVKICKGFSLRDLSLRRVKSADASFTRKNTAQALFAALATGICCASSRCFGMAQALFAALTARLAHEAE